MSLKIYIRLIISLIVSIAVLIAGSMLAYQEATTVWIMTIVLSSIAVAVSLVLNIIYLPQLYMWKRSVERLINKLDNTTENLRCTSSAIITTDESGQHISTWHSVKRVDINQMYISIYAEEEIHILPKASMDLSEFEQIAAFCSRYVGKQTE